MNNKIQKDSILTESILLSDKDNENLPCVQVSYQKEISVFDVEDARKRALSIMEAIACVEYEAKIYTMFLKEFRNAVFDFKNPNAGLSEEDHQKSIETTNQKMIDYIKMRLSFENGVDIMLGTNSKKSLERNFPVIPLILLVIGNKCFPVRLEEAKHHAQILLECCEAGEFDSMFLRFATQILKIEKSQVKLIFDAFRAYRVRTEVGRSFCPPHFARTEVDE